MARILEFYNFLFECTRIFEYNVVYLFPSLLYIQKLSIFIAPIRFYSPVDYCFSPLPHMPILSSSNLTAKTRYDVKNMDKWRYNRSW